MAVLAALAGGIALWRGWASGDLPPEVENALALRELPSNRWVKYHEERPGAWTRQAHAGMAFDTKRGTLLIFGSDTHGNNWDNTVHEFHPLHKRWETHQTEAPKETYRVDGSGAPVAGDSDPMPWAMHTYDGVAYHPKLDALVVMATTDHSSGLPPMPRIRRHPTWVYDLSKRRWSQLGDGGQPAPNFFGGASAYDERRDVLVGYKHGIWEMDIEAGTWRKASAESHHDLHHTTVYDSRRGALFVFGASGPANIVWRYVPGAAVGEAGRWIQHRPTGDPCPPHSSSPVAYDAAQDVFVLVVDDVEPGPPPRPPAKSAATYFYDPEANSCTKLQGADLPAIGMNYMMAWDRNHGVVYLVTGDWRGTVTVWAMRPHKRGGAR